MRAISTRWCKPGVEPFGVKSCLSSRYSRGSCLARVFASASENAQAATVSSARHVEESLRGSDANVELTSKKQDQSSAKALGKKRRLDEVCVELHPQFSRTLIRSWILQGKVLVDDRPATKAGMAVARDASIRINAQVPKYVCRAGLKLEAALSAFSPYLHSLSSSACTSLDAAKGSTDCTALETPPPSLLPVCTAIDYNHPPGEGIPKDTALHVGLSTALAGRAAPITVGSTGCPAPDAGPSSSLLSGCTVLDAGLSTGGFTDCLLQHGAERVYGVDVGYGQVNERIRVDPRVLILERTNLRHLSSLPGNARVDLATLDLSFISILRVMPAVTKLLKASGSHLITLIKPQFEAQRGQVGKGGIVRDPAVREEVLHRVTTGIAAHGFLCNGWIQSPITGTDGNVEYLAHFERIGARVCDQVPSQC